MCLVVESKIRPIPKIALRPIVCYKVLGLDKDGNYFTPYQDAKVTLNRILRAKKNLLGICCGRYRKIWYVNGGWLHLFKYKIDANIECKCIERDNSIMFGFGTKALARYVVVKAEIPIFTRYLGGYYGITNSICAKRVKYSLIK